MIDKTKALEIVHDFERQNEIMATPNHPDIEYLDYVFDLELQKSLFEQENLGSLQQIN